jgi:hypothetical protein
MDRLGGVGPFFKPLTGADDRYCPISVRDLAVLCALISEHQRLQSLQFGFTGLPIDTPEGVVIGAGANAPAGIAPTGMLAGAP